ncbi:hypothetical protein SY83_10915 [Paenibacillus swuensis]|uniref:Uncharacterized protein n=1 Tax=Paenibacillus swuensis TaxID=1178515 RepID=A0A172TI17_9BACL|nr:hypothetical protein [Paenibacillus swuensis]ANE46699.1 hypothetical protein SY83_10915 [Paenibacillus swuensis]
MNKIAKVTYSFVLMGALLTAGSIMYINADGNAPATQPGSANDPVVTKSYVDEQVASLVKAELAKLNGTTPPTTPTKPDQGKPDEGAPSAAMKPVTVRPGQTIIGSEGTEFVVRAGKGTAYTEDGGGLSDLTSAKDIGKGLSVGSNHYVVAPRAGRGITSDPKSKVSLIVLVRGGYTIK